MSVVGVAARHPRSIVGKSRSMHWREWCIDRYPGVSYRSRCSLGAALVGDYGGCNCIIGVVLMGMFVLNGCFSRPGDKDVVMRVAETSGQLGGPRV